MCSIPAGGILQLCLCNQILSMLGANPPLSAASPPTQVQNIIFFFSAHSNWLHYEFIKIEKFRTGWKKGRATSLAAELLKTGAEQMRLFLKSQRMRELKLSVQPSAENFFYLVNQLSDQNIFKSFLVYPAHLE